MKRIVLQRYIPATRKEATAFFDLYRVIAAARSLDDIRGGFSLLAEAPDVIRFFSFGVNATCAWVNAINSDGGPRRIITLSI